VFSSSCFGTLDRFRQQQQSSIHDVLPNTIEENNFHHHHYSICINRETLASCLRKKYVR